MTLNINHRTRRKAVPPELIRALLDLGPEVIVLTEFVEGDRERTEARALLASGGLPHIAVSPALPWRGRTWQNQVLIASSRPMAPRPAPPPAPEPGGDTNILAVEIDGLVITGLRAPAYEKQAWFAYWEWLARVAEGDLLIGDLNADPERDMPKDRVLVQLAAAGGWELARPEGDWSFRGSRNHSRLDHVLARGRARMRSARYVAGPFVPEFTDHAALVVEIDFQSGA